MQKPRRHNRKADRLPANIKKRLHNRLIKGDTYVEIAAYMKSIGYPISKSSIQRYAQPLLELIENAKQRRTERYFK